jgi:hypothetical protein
MTDELDILPTGPFLAAAFLCERVLVEQDGVFSFIRVIDRRTQTSVGPDAPEAMPLVKIDWSLVLAWKAGSARGRSEVTLQIEGPSGLNAGETQRLPVLFEGDDRGVQIVAQLGLELQEEGLYWIDVKLDGRPATRVPFRLLYQRVGRT